MRRNTPNLWTAVLVLVTACADTEQATARSPGDEDVSSEADIADAVPDVVSENDSQAADTESPDTQPAPDIEEDAGPPACVVGVSCDDGDECTWQDQCVDGVCTGIAYECDDGRPCTDDECDADGGCNFTVALGHCLIGNQCIDHASANPDNACERCDTDLNRIGWSTSADSTPCDDENECTIGDYCDGGSCVAGLAATCDDLNDCTQDGCDDSSGCINVPISGPCDDGDKCTTGEVCSGGICQSVAASCDDGNPCTTDTCLSDLGCEHVPFDGPCSDGNACTEGETCTDGSCTAGTPIDCADGSQCTEDQCDPAFGCWYALNPSPCCAGAASLCDDGDPCTLDDCDPETFDCSNVVADLPCSDGNPCTVGDTCSGGSCQSGGAADCNDGNPCTSDACDPAAGCQNTAILGDCDDGIECTVGDACLAGECVGDTSECKCTPDFSPTVAKATGLALAEAGVGLNIDQDANTCAPAPCSDGIDNSLSGLAGLLNPTLETEIAGGGLILLFELVDPKTDGTPFEVRLYAGKKSGDGCNVQTAGCTYLADDATLDEDCGPLVSLDNATIVDGQLTAGGPTYNFPLQIPLFGDTYLNVELFYGTVSGQVTIVGDNVTVSNALVAGAIPKQTFVTAIEVVPEDDLPVPKATIVQLLDLVVINDIDTAPPVGPDAASIALELTAVPGTIIGVSN